MSVFDWSTTASSNGNSDSSINFQEGQAPSTVNDSARALMSRIAFWRNWAGSAMTQGGASNAYTITSGESLSAYVNGMRFAWQPNADSTGAVTLNVDAIGAKKVYMPDGTQAGSADLDADSIYDVIYDDDLDSSAGGFKIAGFPDASAIDGNLSDIQALSDPGADRGLFWDDSASKIAYFSAGTGLQFNGAALEVGANLQVYNANDLTAAEIQQLQNINSVTVSNAQWGYLGATGGTIWTSANDGAGSGLDADTLDGLQGTDYILTDGTRDFSGAVTISVNGATAASGAADDLIVRNESSGSGTGISIIGNAFGTIYFGSSADNDAGRIIYDFSTNDILVRAAGVQRLQWDQSETEWIFGGTVTGAVTASGETTGTLTSASANKSIQMTGDITLNGSVFSGGTMIVLYAGSSSRTITQGSGILLRLDGTATTGSRTLAAYGVAVIFFIASSQAVVAGGGVS